MDKETKDREQKVIEIIKMLISLKCICNASGTVFRLRYGRYELKISTTIYLNGSFIGHTTDEMVDLLIDYNYSNNMSIDGLYNELVKDVRKNKLDKISDSIL